MGIISFIKGGVKELAVARGDEHKDLWVYKHTDQTIPMKAQLTVDADEVALFFKEGVYVGQFGAGRHTLDAQNIPFLGQLIDKFTGGDVFISEVFFVNIREMPSIKFGTTVGDVPDPQTGLRVRLMVHGEFSAKVFDPPKFVTGLVGQRLADNNAFLGWFKGQVQKTLKDDIAELIVKQQWPLMKVTSGAYTEELEEGALEGVRKHIEPYGVEVMRFGDFTIGMDAKDKERLDKLVERAAYINMTGGLEGYQKMAQAEMMMGAGEGMSKGGNAGGAMDGAGIGMGFAMAGQMMNSMNNQQPASAVNTPHSGMTQGAGATGMPDVMSPAQAAVVVQVSEQDILSAIDAGELKARKIGSSYRISKENLQAFLSG